MAKFSILASLLLLTSAVTAKREIPRSTRAARHSEISVNKRFEQVESAPLVHVERSAQPQEDEDEPDWERDIDFVDAADAADEFARILEGQDLEFEEEESLTKRATLIRVNVPGSVKGKKTGIGSWFRTNNKADYTNGKSWCGVKYKDNMMGFAINMDLMSKAHPTYYSNEKLWRSTAKKFCGLEAEVSFKGKKVKMYVMDAFDPAWVRTKYSIDVVVGAFQKLFGKKVSSKNTVMKGISWKMTGRRNKSYGFQG